jgi:hypothetical protein
MPVKSQQQAKYIWAMRRKWGSRKKAPKKMKWVFDQDWTKEIKFKDLPKKVESLNFIRTFEEFNY